MNKKVILLRSIIENQNATQRGLVKVTGFALGSVNKLIRECTDQKLIEVIDGRYVVTKEGLKYLEPYRVEKAVIMAAGLGSRFVPLSFDIPKGLLEVYGEPMVERQIKQLLKVRVQDIIIVVGYMKERFEYLTDKYGLRLIYNPEYETKNNISTIHAVYNEIIGKNTYVLSSDNWMRNSIFHEFEGGAWYSAKHFEGDTSEWQLITDKKGCITEIYPGGRDCNCMLGPAYFSREFGEDFLPILERYYAMPGTDDYFWETVLMECLSKTASKRINAYYGRVKETIKNTAPKIYINLQPEDNVYEFESLEELRKVDPKYMEDSGSAAMRLVSTVFGVRESQIVGIRKLKAGMTNNSWLFTIGDKSYICRIPGKGTDLLINRKEEAAVIRAVEPLGITEKIFYLDVESGYKISEYYEGSRVADPLSDVDMAFCMKKLRVLHDSGISSSNRFEIGEKLRFYEDLCGGSKGVPFADYELIRTQRDELLDWLLKKERPLKLSHIDSVSDNFLFLKGADLSKDTRDMSRIKLIDWEYAGMSDPLIDIGMCAIYSFMQEDGAAKLMKAYFERDPSREEISLVYTYMALGGLLWALWGVYKEQKGVRFTDYTIKMYRYFKKYHGLVFSLNG